MSRAFVACFHCIRRSAGRRSGFLQDRIRKDEKPTATRFKSERPFKAARHGCGGVLNKKDEQPERAKPMKKPSSADARKRPHMVTRKYDKVIVKDEQGRGIAPSTRP